MILENIIWFFCVFFDINFSGRDILKRVVFGDIFYCYFFGRVFGFKVIGRYTFLEVVCGVWGFFILGMF